MSSFQLETLPYSPDVAAILNLTPNHLDRHAGMDAYIAAKQNIVRYQREDGQAVLNADDPIASAIPTRGHTAWFSIERAVNGSYLRDGEIVLGGPDLAEGIRGKIPGESIGTA